MTARLCKARGRRQYGVWHRRAPGIRSDSRPTIGGSASTSVTGAFGFAPCASSAATVRFVAPHDGAMECRQILACRCSDRRPSRAGNRAIFACSGERRERRRATPHASWSLGFAPCLDEHLRATRALPPRAANIQRRVGALQGITRLYSGQAVRRHRHHLCSRCPRSAHGRRLHPQGAGASRRPHASCRDRPHQEQSARARPGRSVRRPSPEARPRRPTCRRAPPPSDGAFAREQRGASGLAPASSRRFTMGALPFTLAAHRGVAPISRFAAFTFAPARMS